MKRYFEDNHAYFLTTKTFKNIPIFNNEKHSKILLAGIEYFKLIFDYRVYGFCIMPDHVHLIIHPHGQYDPSYIMQMIKGNFARKYNKIYKTQGKVWQRRYYDKVVSEPVQIVNVLEYIHNNPVRANIVLSPEEYKFSSYNFYIGQKNGFNVILEMDRFEP